MKDKFKELLKTNEVVNIIYFFSIACVRTANF